MEILRKEQKVLEIKNAVSEMKTTFNRFISRWYSRGKNLWPKKIKSNKMLESYPKLMSDTKT